VHFVVKIFQVLPSYGVLFYLVSKQVTEYLFFNVAMMFLVNSNIVKLVEYKSKELGCFY